LNVFQWVTIVFNETTVYIWAGNEDILKMKTRLNSLLFLLIWWYWKIYRTVINCVSNRHAKTDACFFNHTYACRFDTHSFIMFITRKRVKSTRTAAHESYHAACQIDTNFFCAHKNLVKFVETIVVCIDILYQTKTVELSVFQSTCTM
jgi:hypothetical protein